MANPQSVCKRADTCNAVVSEVQEVRKSRTNAFLLRVAERLAVPDGQSTDDLSEDYNALAGGDADERVRKSERAKGGLERDVLVVHEDVEVVIHQAQVHLGLPRVLVAEHSRLMRGVLGRLGRIARDGYEQVRDEAVRFAQAQQRQRVAISCTVLRCVSDARRYCMSRQVA